MFVDGLVNLIRADWSSGVIIVIPPSALFSTTKSSACVDAVTFPASAVLIWSVPGVSKLPDNFELVTEPSVGVTVPPLSEPSSMAKKLVLDAGAVVNVSVLPDIVKSVFGFCTTPPRDNII